ncbi:MAG TPA: peptide chain release factor N(5)-glutamine methyltransferase [Gemmatimonadaceae bacterium]|nr:peptide chain release factor N(5)-glutamine methyltransferase [Gemmatimonadaceae bacterium]
MATELAHDTRVTVGGALARVAAILDASGVADSVREARELLASLLDQPRSWPALNAETALAAADEARLLHAARRRSRGAPLEYATGRASFRHLVLEVDERVLIPRPETELLVEIALEAGGTGVAVDVCTGSGCVALALAQEGSFSRVIATDASLDALAVARGNLAWLAPTMRAPVELRHGSLLAPLLERGDRASVVVSNPPYIAESEASTLPASVRDWEPAVALFSADGGMSHIRALVREAADVLDVGGLLALEVDARRASLAAELVAADGRYRDVAVRLDLSGRERFVTARRAVERTFDARTGRGRR